MKGLNFAQWYWAQRVGLFLFFSVKVTLVCLLHEDLHDEIISGKIRHLADTCIRLRPPKDKSYHATCHVLHKKTSGKITRQVG